jgi:hypothetical protein
MGHSLYHKNFYLFITHQFSISFEDTVETGSVYIDKYNESIFFLYRFCESADPSDKRSDHSKTAERHKEISMPLSGLELSPSA